MTIKLTDVEFGQLNDLIPSWVRSMRARNLSPKTINGYRETAELFRDFVREGGLPTAVDKITREHVELFIEDQLQRWKPTTANTRHGHLRQLFKYLVDEGELTRSPMERMRPPSRNEAPIPVVTDDELRALFKVCERGKDFDHRRDLALFRLFADTPARLSELSGLRIGDLDVDAAMIYVVGKGSRPRSMPFGPKCSQAIDRYLRLRVRHPAAAQDDRLFLGRKGGLTGSGITQVLRRRCAEAGIAKLHPHQLRHTFAHQWLAQGGNETDLMRLAGWKSRQMVGRYGASVADDRARDAYRKLLPGERL